MTAPPTTSTQAFVQKARHLEAWAFWDGSSITGSSFECNRLPAVVVRHLLRIPPRQSPPAFEVSVDRVDFHPVGPGDMDLDNSPTGAQPCRGVPRERVIAASPELGGTRLHRMRSEPLAEFFHRPALQRVKVFRPCFVPRCAGRPATSSKVLARLICLPPNGV
jgi:hypothetical protein